MIKKSILTLIMISALFVHSFTLAEESATEKITIDIKVEKWVEIALDVTEFQLVISNSKEVNSLMGGSSLSPNSTFTVTANTPYTLSVNGDDSFLRSTDGETFWRAVGSGGGVLGYAIALIPNMDTLGSGSVLYSRRPNEINLVIDPEKDGQTIQMGIGGVVGGKNTPEGKYATPGTYTGTIIITAVCN